MAGLKDQLLKAGLVSEKQIKQAQKEKRKEHPQQSKTSAADEEKRRQKAAADKAERDRQLNAQRQQDAEKKAIAAQVRQIIEANRQPKEQGETPFNFSDGGTVKRLYLSDKLRGQIVRGVLAVVRLDGKYELVPAEVADKIRQRDATAVVLQNEPPRKQETEATSDDPYAAFQVPDDLIW